LPVEISALLPPVLVTPAVLLAAGAV
jgi:hypothetical protein